MTFVKNHWLLFLCGIAALVLAVCIYTGIAGHAIDLAIDQLGLTSTTITEGLQKTINNYEAANSQLKDELAQVKKEKEIYKGKASQSATEVARLEGENAKLQSKLDSIVVPNTADDVVKDLQQRGFGSLKRIK